MNLVQHVTMSSVNAVIPALVRLLTENPQQFLSSLDTRCPLGSTAAGPALRGIDEGHHNTAFNKVMLMKAVPTVSNGQTQDVKTPDSHPSFEERYIDTKRLLREFNCVIYN